MPDRPERPALGLPFADHLARVHELMWQWSFGSLVAHELLPCAGSTLAAAVSEDANERLGKEALGVLGEQQYPGNRELLALGEPSSLQQPDRVGRSQPRGILTMEFGVEIVQRSAVDDPRLVGAVAAVVQELLALCVAQPPRLVADSEVDLVAAVGVHGVAGADLDNEQVIVVPILVDTRNEAALRGHCGLAVLHVRLHEFVAMGWRTLGALDPAFGESDDDGPAVGVCEADEVVRELLG